MTIKTRVLPYLMLLALFLAGPLFAETGEAAAVVPLRRFALIAGSNNGGSTRIRLKYATSDAKTVSSVLTELGGVKQEDMLLLMDPTLASFQAGIRKVQKMMEDSEAKDERREFLLYYSGHSDETGLILGSEIFPYEELRSQVVDVPADVRVAILDSCASGALTRTKGGVARPAFLFDASSEMKGHAFLTSSSGDESAQESDKIGASFFTHYLVSGLRGAADVTGDGLVTLNEAYAFAFQETLASTVKTQYGPQHPEFEINLAGSGDLVLTDLRASSAGLTVADEVYGRMYIRDERGFLAVELNKPGGQPVELGLAPGLYSVVIDRKDGRLRADVQITANRRTVLAAADFKSLATDKTVSRGDAPVQDGEQDPPPVKEFSLSFIPEFMGGLFGGTESKTVSINILVGSSMDVNGFELGGLANIESGSMTGYQGAGLANIVLGNLNGFQGAGLLNFTGRDARFFQAAGLFNFTVGQFMGFQTAGLASTAFGGLTGVQLSGLVNLSLASSRGVQVAGLLNWAQDLVGGVQLSGFGNYAREIAGPQISILNVADTVNGAQIGLINIAGNVKGTQIGLFNFARVIDGVPIGLITIEQAGRQDLEFWYDTQSRMYLAFKLGSRYTYTMFSAGFLQDSDPVQWSYGVGFGGHIPIGPLFADLDISLYSLHVDAEDWYTSAPGNLLPQFRCAVGMSLLGFKFTAGVSVDIYTPYLSTEPDGTPTQEVRLAPAFMAGIQL